MWFEDSIIPREILQDWTLGTLPGDFASLYHIFACFTTCFIFLSDDVDDVIWQDVGLDNSCDVENLPSWLSDDGVRKGIQAKLELDRCNEDLRRLIHKRKALREWMAEEWLVVTDTIDILKGDNGMHSYSAFFNS